MAVPQTADAGRSIDLQFFIPVEQADPAHPQPMVGVVIDVPSGFGVDKVLDSPGWTSTHEQSQVRFEGSAPPNSEAKFSIRGTFSKTGVYAFPLRTTSADGRNVLWRDQFTQASQQHGNVHPAPTVWVGVPRVVPPGPTTTAAAARVDAKGTKEIDDDAPPYVAVGAGFVVVAAVTLVALRRRRAS